MGGAALWQSVVEAQRLSQTGEAHQDYHRRKVWRGFEVAMKIKRSQVKGGLSGLR